MLNIREYRDDIYGAETIKDKQFFDKSLFESLKKAVSKSNKIALYPACDNTIIAKQMLENLFSIKNVLLIDDDLCNTSDAVLSTKEFCKNYSGYIIVITDYHLENYDLKRTKIRENIGNNEIVDAFPIKPLYKQDSRIVALELASREIYRHNIPGAVAEVGVYRGYFSEFINEFFSDRKFYLFDTFQGFDEKDCEIEKENDYSFFRSGEWFLDTNTTLVLDKMHHPENCEFKIGYFPETTSDMVEEKFCFVHLDTDLYEPIKNGLNYFYPRLSKGGYIFVHDFNGVVCKGVRVAVEEFCEENNVGYVCLPDSIEKGTAVIVKV